MRVTDRLKPSEKNEKYELLADFLGKNNHYLLTGHVRADGDAIAAVCFLNEALHHMGKQVCIVLNDAKPDPKYSFLAGFHSIRSIRELPLPFEPQHAIVLDSPNLDRIGEKTAELVKKCKTRICIDHHLENEIMSHLDIIDTNASSTAEILTRLFPYLNIEMTRDIAEILYTGILFDTGNFRFSNTKASTLNAASVLVESGADPEKLNDAVFFGWNILKARSMAQVLQSLTLYRNNRIAISHLPLAFFQSHPKLDRELEGFSDLGITMKGVRIAAFLKETVPGEYRTSLRAVEDFDVESVAKEFGGGGHRKASGCLIKGTYSEVLENLLEAIQRCNPRLNHKHISRKNG